MNVFVPVLAVAAMWGQPAATRAELPASPPQDDDSGPDPFKLWPAQQRSFSVPILEILGTQFVFWGGAAILDLNHARLTFDTLGGNLEGPWQFDDDPLVVNQLGHPIQGSLAFATARSSGLSFWWSSVYTTLSSLSWELFFEAEPPSLNDFITTSLAGTVLGEVTHRLGRALRRPYGEEPGFARYLASALIDPAGALNQALYQGRLDAGDTPQWPDVNGFLYGGAVLSRRLSFNGFEPDNVPTEGWGIAALGAEVIYGRLGPRPVFFGHPFDAFAARVDVALDTSPQISVAARGLLVGGGFLMGASAGGLVGLYGAWNYLTPGPLRLSGSALGPGLDVAVDLSEDLSFRFSAFGGATLWGAAGIAQKVNPEVEVRLGQTGPGLQGFLELRLVHRRNFQLRASVWEQYIDGTSSKPGTALTTLALFTALVNVTAHHAAGIEGIVAYGDLDNDLPGIDQALATGAVRLFYAFTIGVPGAQPPH